jgi:hypothetical protein
VADDVVRKKLVAVAVFVYYDTIRVPTGFITIDFVISKWKKGKISECDVLLLALPLYLLVQEIGTQMTPADRRHC